LFFGVHPVENHYIKSKIKNSVRILNKIIDFPVFLSPLPRRFTSCRRIRIMRKYPTIKDIKYVLQEFLFSARAIHFFLLFFIVVLLSPLCSSKTFPLLIIDFFISYNPAAL
jgi:hypothetical protein